MVTEAERKARETGKFEGESLIDILCPFCGAKTHVFKECVVHEVPMCAAFEDNEPDVYMVLVNDEFARQKGLKIERGGR